MPKHRRRSVDDESSDAGSEISHECRTDHKRKKRKEQHKSKHKKKHKKKDSKKRSRDVGYSSNDDSESGHSRQKRKKSKKQQRHRREQSGPDAHEDTNLGVNPTSHILTQALCHLFSTRPVFAQELPILLIRLAGGSTFDLRQMNDSIAASALESVLECLSDFGVKQVNDVWLFQALPGRRDERVLLRVIRSFLDEVGVTMQAVNEHETKMKDRESHGCTELPESSGNDKILDEGNPKDPVVDRIKDLTSNIVLKYQSSDSELGSQLSGLCQTIAQGEVISIDGLPDTQLKNALEEILIACGLVKAEMSSDSDDEDGDDDDDDDNKINKNDEEPTMGYGLPDDAHDSIMLRLAAVMEACRNPTRRTMGPMRPTGQEATMQYKSDDEDEGPYLPGQERRLRRGPSLPDHIVRAQAEHRELELKATAAGISIPTGGAGGREEWMIVPGKFDFLNNIKTGSAHKSRGFQNKKNRGGGDEGDSEAPIHPAIQAELNAIMQAHKEARGPSLIDEHRAKMAQERAAKAGKQQEWAWSRDKDLDEGRRVDKDALHMVLGGAKDNLKTKFHGGFG